jgi:NADPH:quinone reductase
MTNRINPAEAKKSWDGLKNLLVKELLKPMVYDCEYNGLESVVPAMKDLAARKVWGKAVVLLHNDPTARL